MSQTPKPTPPVEPVSLFQYSRAQAYGVHVFSTRPTSLPAAYAQVYPLGIPEPVSVLATCPTPEHAQELANIINHYFQIKSTVGK